MYSGYGFLFIMFFMSLASFETASCKGEGLQWSSGVLFPTSLFWLSWSKTALLQWKIQSNYEEESMQMWNS